MNSAVPATHCQVRLIHLYYDMLFRDLEPVLYCYHSLGRVGGLIALAIRLFRSALRD
jgi:hypothetical protein